MAGSNKKSVKSTLIAKGFNYHVFKGRLSKGSTISKSIHPVEEVEQIKRLLIRTHKLKDKKEYWELKSSICVGLLMALNLHRGMLVKENDLNQDIFVTKHDADDLRGKLPDKKLIVDDSEMIRKMHGNQYKLSGIYTMEINNDFISFHSADDFSPIEKFSLELMQNKGVISQNIRHGVAKNNECDVVDETNMVQFEIIFEYITELPKNKMDERAFTPEIFSLQLVDNSYIHTSRALIKKMRSKTYTNKYPIKLIIFNVGTLHTTQRMFEEFLKEFDADKNIKNDFRNIYVITYDFINQKIFFIDCKNPKFEAIPCTPGEIDFISMNPVKITEISPENNYMLICKNIFDDSEALHYASGKEQLDFVKSFKIFR